MRYYLEEREWREVRKKVISTALAFKVLIVEPLMMISQKSSLQYFGPWRFRKTGSLSNVPTDRYIYSSIRCWSNSRRFEL